MRFKDRVDAGKQLGRRLKKHHGREVVVLALPRGGVPVAEEVARALDAPLEVLVARKLGAPGNPELGYGALAEGGGLWLDSALVRRLGVTPEQIERTVDSERDELVRRVRTYRGGRSLPDLSGKVAVVVDDGLATGSTARAALRAARELGATSLVLAVPVLPAEQRAPLLEEADEVAAVQVADDLVSVGAFYVDFSPTSDAEVLACLARARSRFLAIEPRAVEVASAGAVLRADLSLPVGPKGVILFAHGERSNRHSPRNRVVAERLHHAGIATLLLDLLTEEEQNRDDLSGTSQFDPEQLAARVVGASQWLRVQPSTTALPIGYFGSSTGAAAALIAAAIIPSEVAAVVCRGGRPDLAGEARLGQVEAPTLMVVGERDSKVLALNRAARKFLKATSRLAVVPEAGHLFAEPGQLQTVADLATAWFERWFERPAVHHSLNAAHH